MVEKKYAHFHKYFAKSADEEEMDRRILDTGLHKGKLCFATMEEDPSHAVMVLWWLENTGYA